jgi:O-antigen/teichoic acid export membrane protein
MVGLKKQLDCWVKDLKERIYELGNHSMIVLIGNIIGKVLSLFMMFIFSRFLGAQTYGDYIFVMSFIYMIVLVPQLGINTGLISFLSRKTIDDVSKQSYVSFSFLITFVAGIILYGIVLSFDEFILQTVLGNFDEKQLFYFLTPLIVLFPLQRLSVSVLLAHKQFKYSTIIKDLVVPLVRLIVVVIIVLGFEKLDYSAMITSIYIFTITVFVILFVKVFKEGYIGRLKKDTNHLALLKYSLPLFFTGIIIVLADNIDKYMIGMIIGTKDIGVYLVAVQVGILSMYALGPITTVLAPSISEMYHDRKFIELNMVYKTISKWMVMIALIVAGFIVVYPKDILSLFGSEFIDGYNVLIAFAMGYVVISLFGPVGTINAMVGNQKQHLIANIISIVFNLVANWILIPLIGINGAAIATILSIVLRNLIDYIFVYIKLKIHPYSSKMLTIAIIISFASFVIFIVGQFLSISIFWKLMILGAIYVVLVVPLLLKYVLSDILFFKQLIEKMKNTRIKS